MTTSYVDPVVTATKFARDLSLWRKHSEHVKRGWLLLAVDEAVPAVEVGFLARLSLSAPVVLPVLTCAIRVSYENYDLWPPSVQFIDAFTRLPARPPVRAFMPTPEGPRDVLIESHPATDQPFLCLPGTREYHSHPQHSGDDWLLHRAAGEGNLMNVCERVWRLMANNVIGLRVELQTLPIVPMRANLAVQIVQGEVDLTALQGGVVRE